MTRRTEVFQIRLSPEEKRDIEAASKEHGLNVSEFIRSSALEWASQKKASAPAPTAFPASDEPRDVRAAETFNALPQSTRKEAEKLAQQIHFAEGVPVVRARDKAYKKLGL